MIECCQTIERPPAANSSQSLRILRVIASTDPRDGGPIEGFLQSARTLQEMGHHCTAVTLDSPNDPWVIDFPYPVIATGHTKWPRWILPILRRYRYSRHLGLWLREHARDYDVIIVSGLWNYCAFACRKVLPRAGVPYFVFTHGMLDPWFRRAYPLKHLVKQLSWLVSEGPLLRHARGVIFTSEEERRSARGAFWPYRINEFVVGYGTNDPTGDAAAQSRAFRSTLPELADRPFMLFLSRIHPKKGCDILIEAFAKLATHDPELQLVMAGPDQIGMKANLATRAAQLGIADRVHWTGMLKGDEKWGAFHACEAFVLPSHSENFGIVVAEALACGKPVLITNKINIWREIEQDGAGLVANDTEEGITKLLKDFSKLRPERREQIGKAARQLFLNRFDLRKNQSRLLELILDTQQPTIK
ncbi:glycosyltransferase [Bradyrhizobium sp. USDA 336]|uniref:glycosyltransferase n=1 Tax=Bradyrhizobium sp. USDA 336 TaxID=3156311 RepID=UPI00384DD0A3